MVIINRPIYVLVPRGVDKDGRLVIDLSGIGMGYDTICEITVPPNKNSMPDPNLLVYILRWLRWYLPDNLPRCEWENLQIQLIRIKNKLIEYLSGSMPASEENS